MRKFLSLGFALQLALCGSGAWCDSTTILVQAPQSRRLDYQAELKAHPDYLSPTQVYIGRHPLTHSRENLLTLFSRAQRAFLQKSEEEAKSKFVAVVALLWTDDWAASDRDIFEQCYLRLAQLAADSTERDHWLSQSLLVGAHIAIDHALYPPPLLERRAELAQKAPRKSLNFRYLQNTWTQLLLNGAPCDNTDCGAMPSLPGKVRLTAISDQYVAQSVVLELRDVDRFRPMIVAWAEGDCKQIQWNTAAAELSNHKLFMDADCEHPALVLTASPPAAAADPIALPPPPMETRTPLYKNKWVWIGVGAAAVTVAGILLYNASQRHSEVHQSSTTYGY